MLLPVSGVDVVVREPTGDDEIYVTETAAPPVHALLGLASRVTTTAAGPVDLAGLPATDVDALALVIRRSWLGEVIAADSKCADQDCGERIDVSFRIGDYLEHHRPRRPRGVAEPSSDGWFTLSGATVRFRIPTIADLLAAQAGPDGAADALSSRCVDAAEIPRALARRLDRALTALAPSLAGLLGGTCPACGRAVALRFDPIGYTVADLRNAFAGIHAEVHVLAAAYGWPEGEILALPSRRRRRYASLVAAEAAVG